MNLEEYARASVAVVGLVDADEIYAALAAKGISKEEWNQTMAEWGPSFADPAVVAAFQDLYRKCLEQAHPNLVLPDFDSYIAGTVATMLGAPMREVAANQGLDMKASTLAGLVWTERMEADPWLRTRFSLLVQKGVSVTGAFQRSPERWISGQLIRARRCPNCQGMKDTPPTTAYVYCDYCGLLFDYDLTKSTEDPTSLDPDDVEAALNEVTIPMQKAAFGAGDKAEYARILRWKNDLMMDVCPQDYSPRIGDPVYREQLLEHVLVPSGVETRFDEAYIAAGRSVDSAREQAVASLHTGALDLQIVLLLLEKCLASFEIEAGILERAGVFQRHPDNLDRQLFLYINRSVFVRPWLGFLSQSDAKTLLAAAGVSTEYINAAQVELVTRGCGHCGAQVLKPAAAQRSLCECCGYLLSKQVVRCSGCSAHIGVPEIVTTRELKCGFCENVFSLS